MVGDELICLSVFVGCSECKVDSLAGLVVIFLSSMVACIPYALCSTIHL